MRVLAGNAEGVFGQREYLAAGIKPLVDSSGSGSFRGNLSGFDVYSIGTLRSGSGYDDLVI